MPTVEHIEALRSLSPRTVIDVGANRGQFSLIARHLFPTTQIYAFEPLESERRLYQSVVSGPVQMHSVALGAEKGSANFLLRPEPIHLLFSLQAKTRSWHMASPLSSTTTVRVKKLESVIDLEALVGPTLLKLDVQGAELQVLQGAEKLLPLVDAIYCEVSFVELYERQPTAGAIVSFLDRHDFALRGVFNLSLTKQFGPTQADSLISS